MHRLQAALALFVVVTPLTTTAETIDAVWKRQTIEISYVSLTTAYSCDLMEARITMLLHHVGAADDIEVSVLPCTGFDRPQSRHQITVTFSTLGAAPQDAVDVVEAAWHEVELGKRRPASIDDRDCELIEQFQAHVLSKIEHEIIEGAAGCSASKRSLVGRLRLKVLKPIARAAAEEGGKNGTSE